MKKFTNVWTYVIIIFLVVVFISSFQLLSSEMLINSNSNLDNDSISYIGTINNIDLSEYSKTSSELEKNDVDSTNGTSTSKDYALEFFFSLTIGNKISTIIKIIYKLPEYLTILMGIPINNINWLINILNWFWRIGILLAIYFLIRGIVT